MYLSERSRFDEDPAFSVTPGQTNLEWSNSTLLYLGISVLMISVVMTCLGFIKRTAQIVLGKQPKTAHPVSRESVVSKSESTNLEIVHSYKVQDFRQHFQSLSSDSYFKLSEEFESLKMDETLTCLAADDPVNRLKNRFVNILPFDRTRFVLDILDDIDGSDYINANYISGFYSSQEFVATQGPLRSTVNDFWRMCCQSETRTIVMLTKCVDKDREKCFRYWPTRSLVQEYGDVEVEIINESLQKFSSHQWAITDLKVSLKNEKSRRMKHFQFLSWPDFGAVDPEEALVRFIQDIRDHAPYPKNLNRNPPIIIHCSAGVGRSGTLIATDIAIQQAKILRSVDIFGIVQKMRQERVWMVQTEQQYICIYRSVLSYLKKLDEERSPKHISVPNMDRADTVIEEL